MTRRKWPLAVYLVINILVSAAVTLAILRWQDNRLPAATPSAPVAAAETPLPTPLPTPVTRASDFEIVAVFGAGQAESEYVLLHYRGKNPVDISGWTLADEDGNRYTFPALMLFPDGMVEVHTAAGEDSAVALYWGLDAAVWQSGETATFFSPEDEPYAVYRIP